MRQLHWLCRSLHPGFRQGPCQGIGKAVGAKCTHPRPSEPSESEMSTVVRSRFSIFTHSSMRRLTAAHAPAGLFKLRNNCWHKGGTCIFPVAAPNRASHILWRGALLSPAGVLHQHSNILAHACCDVVQPLRSISQPRSLQDASGLPGCSAAAGGHQARRRPGAHI